MNFYVNNLTEAIHKIRDTGLDVTKIAESFQHALDLSKKLASEFDYVRVDWYIHEGRIYLCGFRTAAARRDRAFRCRMLISLRC